MCKTILAVVGDAVCSFQQPWYKTEVLCHDDDSRSCKTVNKMIHKISSYRNNEMHVLLLS